MKLALIVTGGLHPSGRVEVMPSWLSLVERLARDHNVHAFVLRHLDRPATYVLAGAQIHDLGRPHGRWSQWKALRRALSEYGPFDLIHGFWVDPGGLLAALAGRQLSVPSVVTCDSGEFTALPDIEYGLQRTARGRAVVALACRLATRVHVTTKFMASLAARHGCDVMRIPIGVDRARFNPQHHPGLSERRESNGRADGPPWTLLQVASLNRVKDHSTLLRAFAAVRQSLDVHLDLVGEDTLGGALQREAAALGVAGRVRFHGFVPNDALGPFHERAHLYVQSSRHEAGGVAVLEAAVAGVPIAGTCVGYVSDWAPHAAIAVTPGDQIALADAIVKLLRDSEKRSAIASAAREFALKHDADWTARELGKLYGSIRVGVGP